SQRPIDRSVNAYDTALPAAREAVHAGDAPYPGRSLAAAAPQYMGRPSNSHNQPLMMRIDVPDGDGQQDQLADQDDQGDDAQRAPQQAPPEGADLPEKVGFVKRPDRV